MARNGFGLRLVWRIFQTSERGLQADSVLSFRCKLVLEEKRVDILYLLAF